MVKNVLFLMGIHVHLTMLTVELKAEASAVTQTQEQRLAPLGLTPAMLDTVAQGIAQAMATLHQRTLATMQLVGRHVGQSVKLLRQAVGDVEEEGR